MAYVDLNTIHNPATGTSPPASWGDAVRDNFEHFNSLLNLGQWTTPTVPTITQGVAVNKTVSHTRYVKLGRLVIGRYSFNITSSGTSANPIFVTTPVTAAFAGNIPVGSGWHFSSTAARNMPLIAALNATTTFAFITSAVADGAFYGQAANLPVPVIGGATGSMATQLLNGHSLLLQFAYESAT